MKRKLEEEISKYNLEEADYYGTQQHLKRFKDTLAKADIPIETGIFSQEVPEEYLVFNPMNELFGLYADNLPQAETQEVRISLFTRRTILKRKTRL